MKNKAYKFLKKYVVDYIENNPQIVIRYELTKKDLSDLKNDKDCFLEWLLTEHLLNNELNGIVLFNDWNEEDTEYIIICQINDRLIRFSSINGNYLTKHEFTFVKKVEVITYRYENINEK